VLTPRDEAALRDALCVVLLAATSGVVALGLARRDEQDGRPVYDPDPDRAPARRALIQPRDRVLVCPTCGAQFLAWQHRRFCSNRCRYRAHSRTTRSLVRQRYPGGGGA
jgi:hypothetical protein